MIINIWQVWLFFAVLALLIAALVSPLVRPCAKLCALLARHVMGRRTGRFADEMARREMT